MILMLPFFTCATPSWSELRYCTIQNDVSSICQIVMHSKKSLPNQFYCSCKAHLFAIIAANFGNCLYGRKQKQFCNFLCSMHPFAKLHEQICICCLDVDFSLHKIFEFLCGFCKNDKFIQHVWHFEHRAENHKKQDNMFAWSSSTMTYNGTNLNHFLNQNFAKIVGKFD